MVIVFKVVDDPSLVNSPTAFKEVDDPSLVNSPSVFK